LREKQRRISKLLSMQERRLLAETAKRVNIEKRLDEATNEMHGLQRFLDRDDPTAMAFSTLVLERLRQASLRRRGLESDLALQLEATLALKRQIKRIDRVAERIGAKIQDEAAGKEKASILERFSVSRNVSVE
jgi:hypothetical protein